MKTERVKTACLVALVALACATWGCSEKKKSNDIIAPKIVKKAPASPIYMQEYRQSKSVDVGGSTLSITIVRQPDDSLAMVKDETGQKFVDNRITLTVTNAQGATIVSKSFTKASFDSYLDDDYRKTGILEGLVFDCVEGSSIRLAASVSHPQTDEYIPLVVTIGKSGAIAISRDTKLDTSSQDEEEEER